MVINKLYVGKYIVENCYILENETTKECIIIDPGSEKDKIRDFVLKNKLLPIAILLTHGHFDHIGACDCYDVPVYIHKDEINLFNSDSLNCADVFNVKIAYDKSQLKLIPIDDNEELNICGFKINVIRTKGHTNGSVSYLFNDKDLFTGDTLFFCSVGRSDLPTGSSDELFKSLHYLLDNLDEGVAVYPGHGDSTTIGFEKKHNAMF